MNDNSDTPAVDKKLEHELYDNLSKSQAILYRRFLRNVARIIMHEELSPRSIYCSVYVFVRIQVWSRYTRSEPLQCTCSPCILKLAFCIATFSFRGFFHNCKLKAAGDKLLMNKFIRQSFGGGLTLKNYLS